MSSLSPSEDPADAIKNGFYVESPFGTSGQISAALELAPSSSHFIVGAIGSGKTTELLMVTNRLRQVPDSWVAFIDVPSVQATSKLGRSVLLALAGKALGALLNPDEKQKLKDELETIRETADGYYFEPEPREEDYDNRGAWAQGVLAIPEEDGKSNALVEAIGSVMRSISPRTFTAIFDGLDRLPAWSTACDAMVLSDIGLLRQASVGSVLVGSIEFRSKYQRHISERFQSVRIHAAVNTREAGGREFLGRVLAKRTTTEMLPEESRTEVVEQSGGIVRDLIGLARGAGEVAYSMEAERVLPEHVKIAADRFGRALLLGLTPEMAARLIKLRPQWPKDAELEFSVATEEDIQLVLRRILVETPGPTVQYKVHPTVRPLIRGLA